jgi:hypothetical protein
MEGFGYNEIAEAYFNSPEVEPYLRPSQTQSPATHLDRICRQYAEVKASSGIDPGLLLNISFSSKDLDTALFDHRWEKGPACGSRISRSRARGSRRPF